MNIVEYSRQFLLQDKQTQEKVILAEVNLSSKYL